MEENSVILIGAVFLVAGFGKGVTGMGLPTFSMALLGMMMPTAAAAALMILPSLATNLAQCMGPNFRALARRFWPMWLAMALATIFSPFLGLGAADNLSRVALGLILVAYALWGLVRPSLPLELCGIARASMPLDRQPSIAFQRSSGSRDMLAL